MLNYIKNQCIDNNIKYENKPNITTEELNIYNRIIEDRNIEIDNKLNGSIWIRKNDAISSTCAISLECNICTTIRDVAYGNLMKVKRPVPECTYCFHEIKAQELHDIISLSNWKLIGKYIHHGQHINIECNTCQYQRKCMPDDTMYKKFIIGCPKCLKF